MGCGYHRYCGSETRFISRYRGISDYCVAGERVSVSDSGETRACGREATDSERQAILVFLLEEYAEYISWHIESGFEIALQPFDSYGLERGQHEMSGLL